MIFIYVLTIAAFHWITAQSVYIKSLQQPPQSRDTISFLDSVVLN